MKIITLSGEQFTAFAKKHKYRSFYQTVNYGKLMKIDGYDYHLLGFLNNSNELIGATMILFKKVFFSYKMAYAPFGFLIDYTNNDLIEEMTDKLKKLLLKQKFLYIKINPRIECSRRDKNGNIKAYNPEINDITEILQNNNYIHHGFNNYFENMKPRWNAILKLKASNENLYKDLSKQTRNKISKAKKCGIEVREADLINKDELNTFFDFIKRKHDRSYKYYQRLLKEFGDKAKIYFAVLNTEKYLIQSKENYEFELNKNEFLNYKLQNASRINTSIDKIIKQKMESDKIVSYSQKHLIDATNLFSKRPEGIIVAGNAAEYLYLNDLKNSQHILNRKGNNYTNTLNKNIKDIFEQQDKIVTYSYKHNIKHDLKFPYEADYIGYSGHYINTKNYVNKGLSFGFIVCFILVIMSSGIISREHDKGTIKLLLTAPVKREKILLSKYLYLIVNMYLLWIIGIIFIFIISGIKYGFSDLFVNQLILINNNVSEINYFIWYVGKLFIHSIPVICFLSFMFFLSTTFKNTVFTSSICSIFTLLSLLIWVILDNLKIKVFTIFRIRH